MNNMMNGMFTSTQWDLSAMLKTSGITHDVQQHLVRVYATLAAAVLAAAISAITLSSLGFNVADHNGSVGLLSFLGSVGGSIWLQMEPTYNYNKRFAILLGIAACTGASISSLIDLAMAIDPSVLITAFLMATTVFLCFTGSAMFAQRRQYLFLGGLLSSALSAMCLMSVLNLFFRSVMLYSLHLYAGLFVFCGYVMFDTQLIIEKASSGDKDATKHALELFLDFVSLFVRIAIILLQNSDKKKRSDDRKSRR